MELYKAIEKLRDLVPVIDKNSKGYNYNYADLPSILEKIKEPMKKCGLIFIQTPDGLGRLKTIIHHPESKGSLEGVLEMKSVDDKAQTYGSMLTYMRRYSLVTMLGLNVDEDDDGAIASGKNKKESYLETETVPF